MPQPPPDTTDMLAVHGALRDTLAAAPGHIGAVATDEAQRRALIANYFENIICFLEVHHDGEEQLVFPLLGERCPVETPLLERMQQQHEAVVDLMGQARDALQAWAAAGDEGAQESAAARFGELHRVMVPHLSEEEAEVLPLCGANLSMEEWGALPGYSMGHFAGDKIWLVLGLIRQRMTQAQRDIMLAHMPPRALEMWTSSGEAAFVDLAAAVAVPIS